MVLPIFIKILEAVFKCCNSVAKPLHRFKTKVIYWNLYLRFFLEAFLELSIVSLLRLRFIKATTLTETILSIYAVFILVMLSGYMGGIVPFLRYKHELIDTDYFKDRFGALTLGLQQRDKSAMLYPFVFMLRRFIFSTMVVFLSFANYFQIQILVFKTSMIMAFQG